MRGDCTFSQKVKMAHFKNAVAVVIVNKVSENGVITALIKGVSLFLSHTINYFRCELYFYGSYYTQQHGNFTSAES